MDRNSRARFRHAAALLAAVACNAAFAGYGGVVVSPSPVDFGEQPIQTSSPTQLISVNVGTPGESLSISSITLAAPFQRDGGTCPSSGTVAAPPCTVGVRFAPDELNEFNESLVVSALVNGSPFTGSSTLLGVSVESADLGFSPGDVSFNQSTVTVGDQVSLSISPTNAGPSSVGDILVFIENPKELELVGSPPSNANWFCNLNKGPGIVCQQFTPKRSRGSLPPLPNITYVATAPANPASTLVRISSNVFDGNAGNDSVLIPLVINGLTVDLEPQFDDADDPVQQGAPLRYEGQVANNGTGPSSAVQLKFDTTPDLVFSGATGNGWSCTQASGFVLCGYSKAIPGGVSSPFLQLTFVAPSTAGTVSTLVENLTADDNPGNDSQTITTEVGNNDFALTGSAAPTSGSLPYTTTVTLMPSVSGAGAGFGTSYQITASLPAGVSYLGATESLWMCNPSGSNPVSCTLPGGSPQRGASALPPLELQLQKSSSGSSSIPFVLGSDSSVPDPNPANNTYTLVLNGLAATVDLKMVKTASVTQASVGQAFDYTLRVSSTSSSNIDAAEVSIDDALPAGLELLGISFGSGTGSWDCNSGTPTLQCSLGTDLPPNAQAAPIILRVRYPGPALPSNGQISNTASVSSGNSESAPADNSSSVTVRIVEASNLRLVKTASRPQLAVGQTLTFTLDVSNPGSVDATGVIVLDPVPAAFEVSAVQSDDFACSRDGNNVDCRRSTFAGGASGRISISATARSVGTHVNTANVTSVQGRTPVNASTRVEVQGSAAADLVVRKTTSASSALALGQVFDYSIEVRNEGGSEARDVVIADVLPEGIRGSAVELSGATCSTTAAGFQCTLATPLAPAAAVTARFTVVVETVPESGCRSLTNTATATTSSAELSQANNSSTVSVSLCAGGGTPLYDLVVQASPASATAGAQTFNVRIMNTGPAGYPGGPLEIDFGSTNLRLESFPNCTAGNAQAVSCLVPALLRGESVNLPLSVRTTAQAPAAGRIRIVATPVPPGDSNLADNTAFIDLTVVDTGLLQADLQLTARALASDGLAGSTANFEFVASNLGPAVATGVVVLLDLPAGSTLGNAQSTGATCVASGNQVRCTANADLQRTQSLTVTLGLRLPSALGDAVVSGTVSSPVQDVVPGNNSASASVRVRIEEVSEVAAILSNCAGNDRIAQISVDALARACADPNSPLQPLCRQLVGANSPQACTQVREALSEIAPKDVLAQSLMLRDFANTQFFNVDARLNDLRGGGGGFNLSGLNINTGKNSMSLGTLQDLARAVRGDEADAESTEYDSDLVKPWGFFLNGTISSGEQDLNTDRYRVKADFESRGITAGVDYRFKSNLVGGIAVGFAKFDADVSDASSLDTRAFAITAYGSWYPLDRLYVDARVSMGSASFDLDRRIDFSIGGQNFNTTALGSTDADQLTFATSVGHHYNVGGWNLTPSLAFRYVRSDVDAFTESGADVFNVAYGDQSISNSQLALGLQVSRAFSLSSGIISPQFDISMNRDFSDDELVLEARLAGAGAGGVFQLREEDPDQSYGSVGLGFVYVTANGKQAYLSYRRLVGQDGVERGTVNFGARFEF